MHLLKPQELTSQHRRHLTTAPPILPILLLQIFQDYQKRADRFYRVPVKRHPLQASHWCPVSSSFRARTASGDPAQAVTARPVLNPDGEHTLPHWPEPPLPALRTGSILSASGAATPCRSGIPKERRGELKGYGTFSRDLPCRGAAAAWKSIRPEEPLGQGTTAAVVGSP